MLVISYIFGIFGITGFVWFSKMFGITVICEISSGPLEFTGKEFYLSIDLLVKRSSYFLDW